MLGILLIGIAPIVMAVRARYPENFHKSSLLSMSRGSYSRRRHVPAVLKRQFDDWSQNNSCNYERIKTVPAVVMLTRMNNESVLFVRTNLVNDGFEFKRLKLNLEIHGISLKTSRNGRKRKYIAEVQSSGNNTSIFNITSSNIHAKDKIWEVTFDMTTLYKTSRNSFHKDATLRIKFIRKNKKQAKFLMKKNTKAYYLLYQKVKSCSLLEYFEYDGRFQTSIDIFRSESILKNAPNRRFEDSQACDVRSFNINFMNLGLNFIIYPEAYDIGMCGGICPIKNLETGYQFIQNFLVGTNNRGQSSGCRPSQYGSMVIIYEDYVDKMTVLSKFVDTTVQQCECRL